MSVDATGFLVQHLKPENLLRAQLVQVVCLGAGFIELLL